MYTAQNILHLKADYVNLKNLIGEKKKKNHLGKSQLSVFISLFV